MESLTQLFRHGVKSKELKRKLLMSRLHLALGAAGILAGVFIISERYVLGLLVGHVGIGALVTSLGLYAVGMYERAMEVAVDFLEF